MIPKEKNNPNPLMIHQQLKRWQPKQATKPKPIPKRYRRSTDDPNNKTNHKIQLTGIPKRSQRRTRYRLLSPGTARRRTTTHFQSPGTARRRSTKQEATTSPTDDPQQGNQADVHRSHQMNPTGQQQGQIQADAMIHETTTPADSPPAEQISITGMDWRP